MSEWKIKRTWETVEVQQNEAGFLLTLDDRPIVTPAKNPLLLPSNALATRGANEWMMKLFLQKCLLLDYPIQL